MNFINESKRWLIIKDKKIHRHVLPCNKYHDLVFLPLSFLLFLSSFFPFFFFSFTIVVIVVLSATFNFFSFSNSSSFSSSFIVSLLTCLCYLHNCRCCFSRCLCLLVLLILLLFLFSYSLPYPINYLIFDILVTALQKKFKKINSYYYKEMHTCDDILYLVML